MKENWYYVHSLHVFQLFVALSGLYARLCHTFLVINQLAESISFPLSQSFKSDRVTDICKTAVVTLGIRKVLSHRCLYSFYACSFVTDKD